jgi:hypothetical protein
MQPDRKVIHRQTFAICQTEEIRAFFVDLGPFRATVEATASYEWVVSLIEPLADKVVLANFRKLRVIAESVKKMGNLDAQVLAEFLVLDMIPEAYRPGPRQREHWELVRQRQYLKRCGTALKNKMRWIASAYNVDRKDLFTGGWKSLEGVKLTLGSLDRQCRGAPAWIPRRCHPPGSEVRLQSPGRAWPRSKGNGGARGRTRRRTYPGGVDGAERSPQPKKRSNLGLALSDDRDSSGRATGVRRDGHGHGP